MNDLRMTQLVRVERVERLIRLARLSPLEEGIPRNWLIIRNPIQEVCTKSAGVSL
jgi:hypothetical protein